MNYTVELARSTYSEIKRLPAKVVERIMEAIQGRRKIRGRQVARNWPVNSLPFGFVSAVTA